MTLNSSPLTYPPSSSPPAVNERRKRKLPPGTPYQLKHRRLWINDEFLGHSFRRPSINGIRVASDDKENHHRGPITTEGPFIDYDSAEDAESDRESNIDSRADCVQRLAITETMPRSGEGSEQSPKHSPRIKTSSGKTYYVDCAAKHDLRNEQLIASRPVIAFGKLATSFYGVDIHRLVDQIPRKAKQQTHNVRNQEVPCPSNETPQLHENTNKRQTMLWTEKYRARRFVDLVGDERTHRNVLRWIKCWDPVVFPCMNKPKQKAAFGEDEAEQRQHRKILVLTGSPGLGKTTLAHVCARQAGYEVVEINASDERSSGIVKGRIRDCIGTENVRGINSKGIGGTTRKAGKPVCVVVDEVDGVVSGSSGEGGFIRALVDLVALDQRNSTILRPTSEITSSSKKKGDKFRFLRPMILICNDVYHPALRPLRASNIAEIIHIRKPPLDKVVARLKTVFDKEGVACDNDGVRRLCEAAWGFSNRKENRNSSSDAGEGDMRGIFVIGEWVATKMRASAKSNVQINKKWVEENLMEHLSHGGGSSRGLGRSGAKETVERVFSDGAGFPQLTLTQEAKDTSKISDGLSLGVSELAKGAAMDRLREMIDMGGESDRILNDCFIAYPTHSWQDDTLLSKPNAAYEWLHFHDRLSSKVHIGQDWELAPYLSHSILGFHHLFASPAKHFWATEHNYLDENEEQLLPFSGPRADYSAFEAHKQNQATLLGLQSSLSIPLLRSFRSSEDISMDLLPHLIRMLMPDVKPTIVGSSGDHRSLVSVRKEGERDMIRRAVEAMAAVGVRFERVKVEASQTGINTFIYRMEP